MTLLRDLVLFFGSVAILGPVLADDVAVAPSAPDVQTLVVTKDVPSGTVILNWSDGAAPFSVTRSESPDFLNPTNLFYVTRSTTGGPVTDSVLADTKTYFYLVSDANTATEIFDIRPASAFEEDRGSSSGPLAIPIPERADDTSVDLSSEPERIPASPLVPPAVTHEGSTLMIDGKGFSAICANNSIYLEGGQFVTPTTCDATHLEAQVPLQAISGSLVVVSPNGLSSPKKSYFAVGLGTNPAFGQLSHINVDATHNIFACDQTNLRIWKLDFNTGATNNCTSQQTVGNVVGLPRNNNGKFNFAADSTSSFNAGTVRELDPTNCTFISWGDSGTASTDPVDPRALAYDKSGANNLVTFVLDYAGDRVRTKANGMGVDTMWLTGLGLGDNTPAASRPGGFTFNTAGEFFYTGQSTIVHRSQVLPRPIIQTFSSGLNHPAQLETDDEDRLWVANRDANNVLKIRTTVGNTLVRTKITDITTPRGVALDQEPGTNRPWVYVADQTNIYRFRRYRTVHLDIKVLNEALAGVSQAEFESTVRNHVDRARAALTQCDVELVIDRIVFVPDPNGAGGALKTKALCTDLLPEEQMLLSTQRGTAGSDYKPINVYYVHHFLEQDQQNSSVFFTTRYAGWTYSDDCYATMNNGTESGIVVARFASSPAGTTGGPATAAAAIPTTLGHETGHMLLDSYANPLDPQGGEHAGNAPCGTPPNPNDYYLMHIPGCTVRYKLTTGPGSECENIRTNPNEAVTFIELF